MLRGLALAATLPMIAAVTGGNLAVTTSTHPAVWRYVRVVATGEVKGSGVLYLYRNRGVPCGAGQRDQRKRGVRELHAPVPVQGAFDFETAYLPRTFGRKESICSYLYTTDAPRGLPPDAAFFENDLRIRFAVPAGGRWRAHGLRMRALGGHRDRVAVAGTCAGRAWRIASLKVGSDGSFAYAGPGAALTGRFRGVTSVRATVGAPGCRPRALRLHGGAPRPPEPKLSRQPAAAPPGSSRRARS